jgi:hypothetical protein
VGQSIASGHRKNGRRFTRLIGYIGLNHDICWSSDHQQMFDIATADENEAPSAIQCYLLNDLRLVPAPVASNPRTHKP